MLKGGNEEEFIMGRLEGFYRILARKLCSSSESISISTPSQTASGSGNPMAVVTQVTTKKAVRYGIQVQVGVLEIVN